MPAPVPMAVWQIKNLVTAHLAHTRPVATPELLEAINFGLGKVRRALRSVRMQPQMSFVDDFTIAAGTTEYDVSLYSPPLIRPVKLTMPLAAGSAQNVYFRYYGSESQEYIEAESNPQASYTWVVYDMMDGLFPGRTPAVTMATTTTITVAEATLPVGTYIQVPGSGTSVPAVPPPNTTTLPADYYGLVTSVGGGGVMTVSPNLTVVPTVGMKVRELRRRLLRFVPALQTSISGRLWYQYSRERLVMDTDLVEPNVAEHIDCLVAYALSRLKLSVGDADTDRWLSQAEAMRSEMMQDVDLGSWGNTEHLGSGLIGVSDW
jgi:hypothetical protein